MANAGDWVRIHQVVLGAGERAPQVPGDTAQVPLELFVKGWLIHDAQPGDTVSITTRAGRVLGGTLLQGGLGYTHSFGEPVTELMRLADSLLERRTEGPHG